VHLETKPEALRSVTQHSAHITACNMQQLEPIYKGKHQAVKNRW